MSKNDPLQAINELVNQDRRYRFDAYVFVFEALRYAQKVLKLGAAAGGGSLQPDEDDPFADEDDDPAGSPERHVTGQQLCEAIRHYALEQYGYLAKCVLNSWGIHNTGDFGEIVFNLIRIEQMRKTPQDRREDFDNVYDFDYALVQHFEITMPEK